MLTLGIRYLTGCVVASDVADRRRVEWPPHPGRVFMALAAAHFESGDDPGERAALEWLEQKLPPPQIYAPSHTERRTVTQYVPVNDEAGPSNAPVQSLPGVTRKRQPRAFARAWIGDDLVYLFWPEIDSMEYFPAIRQLCGKVTRIGHSTSLVQMWASQEAPSVPANWLPDELRADRRFRVAGSGLLQYLERQFNKQQAEAYFELVAASQDSDKKRQKTARVALKENFQNQAPVRLRPELSISHGYAPRTGSPELPVRVTAFDPRLLVFALERSRGSYRHLDLPATLQLTARFREALLSHLGADIPEVLSGHDGQAPSEHPHIAILPLPFVGRQYAHGGIIGIAVAVPRDIGTADRQRLLRSLAALRAEGLRLGALGDWKLEPSQTAAERDTLRDRVWTANPGGARQWATVTPYVFDRHAKAKDKPAYQRELADSVRQSWERVRESEAALLSVSITPVSAHLGAPPAHEFPRLERKDGSQCRHTHAVLTFDQPVVGPVLLGAGRYRGYGLCRPL